MKKNLLLAIISLIVLLGVLEIAARLAENLLTPETDKITQKGWQADFFSSNLDWHESDPDFLWRHKPNLDNPLIKTNSERTLGGEISKKKNNEDFRILLIGDSSPVGLGLKRRSQAFGEQFRAMLENEYIGLKNIELINASVSGYTSEQAAVYLKRQGLSYNPDLVILYCGNNDASISGAFSDRELLEGQKLKPLRRLLNRAAIYRTLKQILIPSRRAEQNNIASLKVRVSPERYRENLEIIADACRRQGCPLIILKPPVPYLWPAGLQFKLFRHITGESGELIFPDALAKTLSRKIKYCLDLNHFREIYGEGDIFTREVFQSAYNDSLSPADAIEHYSEILEKESTDPVALNNLGVSFWQNRQYDNANLMLKAARELYRQNNSNNADAIISAGTPILYNIGINLLSSGKLDEAYLYLDSALQGDFLSLRIKKSYHDIIDSFNSRDGVTVIDLPEIYRMNGGEKLFIDHCHPTEKGHRLIADALYNQIRINGYIK